MTTDEWIEKAYKLIDIVRSRPVVTVRGAARSLKCKQEQILEMAEDMELNINVAWGIPQGGGVKEFDCIGDYVLEDLNYTKEN